MSYLLDLVATSDGTVLPADRPQGLHGGRPLLARYDLERLRREVPRTALQGRPESLWRYAELLPLRDPANPVTLGECRTPLLAAPRLARALGLERLTIKDESLLPTGSFKARGMAVAVSRARELGIRRIAVPSAGNAGGALAAYAARAGIECFVFVPEDTPIVNRNEAALYGAHVFLVDGLIGECGRIVREGAERMGWFPMSTLQEPYRLEGKKTMGLELAEQLGWRLPDAIFYPTGGGVGLIGMWKAFDELEALGWLAGGRRPRMFAVQSSGCAPIARAFDVGGEASPALDHPHTEASGLRVPKPLGDFLVLRAVRASGGRAMALAEERLREWLHLATRLEGVALCPESAFCLGAVQECVARGWLRPDAEVVVFNTGAAQKYVELTTPPPLPRIAHRAVDWQWIAGAAGSGGAS